MKKMIVSGRTSPKKENVRKVCELMGWDPPMFADAGAYGYSCKWGGYPITHHYSKEEIQDMLDLIEKELGIQCKLQRSGKLMIPYAD